MRTRTSYLLAIAVVSFAALFVTTKWCYRVEERSDAPQMRSAASLASSWYTIIKEEKLKRDILTETQQHTPYSALIGDEYSEITTTLGSVEAKTAAADPEFAAVLVKVLHDAHIHSGSNVGVICSGSFPSLTIATLAALQTIGSEVVMMSSLGASSYGANQPQATWIDMEHWLQARGGLRYKSSLVTFGAEGDSGGGISEEGIAALKAAAERNNVKVYVPESFEQSVEQRVTMLKNARIALLVNIGGNQTSLGYCSHSTTIPNGYHAFVTSCMEEGRGVIVRMSESGIPFIHLLNIRDLAVKNGLPLIPDGTEPAALYTTRETRKIPVLIMTGIILLSLIIARKKSL